MSNIPVSTNGLTNAVSNLGHTTENSIVNQLEKKSKANKLKDMVGKFQDKGTNIMKYIYSYITFVISIGVLSGLLYKRNQDIDNSPCTPVCWNDSLKSILESGIEGAEGLSSALKKTYQIQSNYNSSKNTYMVILVLFVIGNSAPYYYFENLKNKDAWPSHGLGGLLRKIIVHCIGAYFLYTIPMYIVSSTKTLGSDELDEKGCSYIACPEELLDKNTMDNPILIVSNTNKDNIKELIAENNIKDLKAKLNDDYAYINDGKATTTTKTNSTFLFIIIAVFTIMFAHFLTIKGFPIYGVTYFYNPLSCGRLFEMIGYIFGKPDGMIWLNENINEICGHTYYGSKNALYDCYKMRNIPVYDLGFGNGTASRIMSFIHPLNWLRAMYIYTSATLLLNPIAIVILCIVGFVSATPAVFVSGSNAINALGKKINMFILKRWLFYFTQGRCYKGNVFAGVIRRLCTFGLDPWVADALFNNEHLGLACENTMNIWWTNLFLKPDDKNSTQKVGEQVGEQVEEEVKEQVEGEVKEQVEGEVEGEVGGKSWRNRVYKTTGILGSKAGILGNKLSKTADKYGLKPKRMRSSYFGQLLQYTLIYFVATGIYNGFGGFIGSTPLNSGMIILNICLICAVIIILIFTHWIGELPDISYITELGDDSIKLDKTNNAFSDMEEDHFSKLLFDIGKKRFSVFYKPLITKFKDNGEFTDLLINAERTSKELYNKLSSSEDTPEKKKEIEKQILKIMTELYKKRDDTGMKENNIFLKFIKEFTELKIDTLCDLTQGTKLDQLSKYMIYSSKEKKELEKTFSSILDNPDKVFNLYSSLRDLYDYDPLELAGYDYAEKEELKELKKKLRNVRPSNGPLKNVVKIQEARIKYKLEQKEDNLKIQIKQKEENLKKKIKQKEDEIYGIKGIKITPDYFNIIKQINKILYNNDNLDNMPNIEPFKTLKKLKKIQFEQFNENMTLGKFRQNLYNFLKGYKLVVGGEQSGGDKTQTGGMYLEDKEINALMSKKSSIKKDEYSGPRPTQGTFFVHADCNDPNTGCCIEDATIFGKIINDQFDTYKDDGTPTKNRGNLFKSSICSEEQLRKNIDNGEEECLKHTYYNKDDMQTKIFFKPINSKQTNPTNPTNPTNKPSNFKKMYDILTWNSTLKDTVFSKPNIPHSVCTNLLISNMLFNLDKTLHPDDSKLKSFEGKDKDVDMFKHNLLEHPRRKYYPLPELNPFDASIQLFGQKCSDWTQFFTGSSQSEDKSIFITSSAEGGLITLRDSYLYTLLSDKENDSTVESCMKMYCNKPRCFEVTKQCSKYPTVFPDKVFVDHKYMKSTCPCSEIDGLMPIQYNKDDEDDPKYWVVHTFNKKPIKQIKSDGPKRTMSEIEGMSGINYKNSLLENAIAATDEVLKPTDNSIDKEGQIIKQLEKGIEDAIARLKVGKGILTNNVPTKNTSDTINKLKEQLNKIKALKTNDIASTYKELSNIKNILGKISNDSAEQNGTELHNMSIVNRNQYIEETPPTSAVVGGGTYTEQQGGDPQTLGDLFGRLNDRIKQKQNTGHTYFTPIEYLDTKNGRKIEIDEIKIDPVHSKIKVDGISETINFTEDKLREVVDVYIKNLREKEELKQKATIENQLKHNMSHHDYEQYKRSNGTTPINDKVFSSQDKVVGTYETHDDAIKKMTELGNMEHNNQTGGRKGSRYDAFIKVGGKPIKVKVGNKEQYITETGELISVKKYKDENNYIDLLMVNNKPMKILVKGLYYYITKDQKMIRCNK